MANEVGTRIFYTGDMANASGTFKITANDGGWVTLTEENGTRTFRQVPEMSIGKSYDGTCRHRFVPFAAYETYKAERLAALRAQMGAR